MKKSYDYGKKHHDLLLKKAENETSINKAKGSLPWLTFLTPISEIFSGLAITVAISFTFSNPMVWPVILLSLLSFIFPCWTNVSLFKNIKTIEKLLKENKELDKQIEFEETMHKNVEIAEENVNDKVIEKNTVIEPNLLKIEEENSNEENNSNNFTL